MKQVLLFILLCATSLGTQAQQITDEGNRWFLNYSGIGGPPGFLAKKIEGDTLLQENGESLIYKKLYRQTTAEGTWTLESFVREIDGKVYVRQTSETESTIVYDYNLNVGDSFQFGISEDPTMSCEFLVTEIDDITTEEGNSRKQFHLSIEGNPFSYVWIEGVGSDYGLFKNPACNLIVEDNEWIKCLWSNDDLTYSTNVGISDVSQDCWWTDVGINEFTLELNAFPNPSNDVVRIDHNEPLELFYVYDLMGKLLESGPIADSNLIEVGHFPSGRYLLVVENSSGERGQLNVMKL